jgi:hypothetical protein
MLLIALLGWFLLGERHPRVQLLLGRVVDLLLAFEFGQLLD